MRSLRYASLLSDRPRGKTRVRMGSHACYGVPYPAGPYELRGELERIPPLAIPPRSPQAPERLAAQAARGLGFQHACIKGEPGLSLKMVLCVLLPVFPKTFYSAAEGPSWNIRPTGCRKCRPRQDGIAGDLASGASVHAA